MEVLHTRLHPNTFVVGKRDHGGSIARTNDASCYIMMEKMSPQNCSRGGPCSEAHDLNDQSHDYWRVSGSEQARADQDLARAFSLAASLHNFDSNK
jgi:hypothetical protein